MLCLLIYFFCIIYRPDVLDHDKLVKEEPIKNLNVAFDTAERDLGILRLLDAPGLSRLFFLLLFFGFE